MKKFIMVALVVGVIEIMVLIIYKIAGTFWYHTSYPEWFQILYKYKIFSLIDWLTPLYLIFFAFVIHKYLKCKRISDG